MINVRSMVNAKDAPPPTNRFIILLIVESERHAKRLMSDGGLAALLHHRNDVEVYCVTPLSSVAGLRADLIINAFRWRTEQEYHWLNYEVAMRRHPTNAWIDLT